MGLFNDFRNAKRENWLFAYKGSELAPFAKKKYEHYTLKETEARLNISDLLRDPNVRANDERIEKLKRDIEKFGDEREKCLVWVHEFGRRLEESFSLALGDVTYFDIAPAVEFKVE